MIIKFKKNFEQKENVLKTHFGNTLSFAVMTIEAGLDFGCGEGTLETNNNICILIFIT